MARRTFWLVAAVAVPAAVASLVAPAGAQEGPAPTRKVVKTDAEWAKVLTRDQFNVTRRKATEPPFSGRYVSNHAKGTYLCVCCGAPLFASQTKFDSGTGWPSFWKPIDPKQIETAPDYELGEPRVEVKCKACGGHLGHVFNDGPPPTYLRFCINSLSLKFLPGTGAAASDKAKAKTKKKSGNRPTPSDPAPSGDTAADPKADSPAEGKSDPAPGGR